MAGRILKRLLRFMLLLAFGTAPLRAQRVRGELRVEVRDTQGASLSAQAELLSEANQVHRTFQVARDGRYTAPRIFRSASSASLFAPKASRSGPS